MALCVLSHIKGTAKPNENGAREEREQEINTKKRKKNE